MDIGEVMIQEKIGCGYLVKPSYLTMPDSFDSKVSKKSKMIFSYNKATPFCFSKPFSLFSFSAFSVFSIPVFFVRLFIPFAFSINSFALKFEFSENHFGKTIDSILAAYVQKLHAVT